MLSTTNSFDCFQSHRFLSCGQDLETHLPNKDHLEPRRASSLHKEVLGSNTSRWLCIFESRHEMSNNVVYATSKASDQPARMHSLIRAFASCLNILLTEHYLEFLSLKGGCTGSSEPFHVKM